ncbi:MAG: hypothetical protein EBZ69_02850 [Alphaproteobacteria bacterium]|nr:hypothetical protein [Alphaproteobacteria bacterium]
MTKSKQDPFQPFSRSNPVGFHTREVTITVDLESYMEDGDSEAEGEDGDLEEAASAAPAPIRLAISSEAAVERMDWATGDVYLEVLDHGPGGPNLEYVRDGIPFLLDHDLGNQIGLGTTPELGADRILRTDVIPGNHPDAGWVFADMAAGIRRKVSIGYWPGDTYTETRRADGMRVRRYRGWTLFEASSVAVPADYAMGMGRGYKPMDEETRPITDFPEAGGDTPVSLDNSRYAVFPVREATQLQEDYPSVWGAGGNIRGNDQFRILAPVAERGGEPRTEAERDAIKLREAWAARHAEDFRLPGVIAQVKWLVVGSRGLEYMRDVIKEATDAVDAEEERAGAGVLAMRGSRQTKKASPASGRELVRMNHPAAAAQATPQERTMDTNTAPVPGTAPASDQSRREARSQELAVLARNFPTHARLADWIADGVTVDAARDEVMRKLATTTRSSSGRCAPPAPGWARTSGSWPSGRPRGWACRSAPTAAFSCRSSSRTAS